MSESPSARYESDLFVLAYDDWGAADYPWAAWARCEIDVMAQAVACFRNLQADGFGHDTYGWYNNLYLRRNRVAQAIELVVEDDGYGDECSVEHAWEAGGTEEWDTLVDACYAGNAKAAFESMLAICSDVLRIRPLTAADEAAIKQLPIVREARAG